MSLHPQSARDCPSGRRSADDKFIWDTDLQANEKPSAQHRGLLAGEMSDVPLYYRAIGYLVNLALFKVDLIAPGA